jgi:hypothetical protein
MADHKLYNGEVTLRFDGRKHAYSYLEQKTADGTPLFIAGVTSILGRMGKPALIPWASNMAAEYFLSTLLSDADRSDPNSSVTITVAEAEEIAKYARKAYAVKTKGAADVGKLVHAFAEAYLKGDKASAEPKQKLTPEELAQYHNGVSAFKLWMKDHEVEIIASERVLFSKRWMYAGTTDLVARINGKKCVADFKTSSGLYVDMSLQLAAYRIALEEEDDTSYPYGALIHLNKETGQYDMMIIPRNKEHEECFLSLRECDEIMKRLERSWPLPRKG